MCRESKMSGIHEPAVAPGRLSVRVYVKDIHSHQSPKICQSGDF